MNVETKKMKNAECIEVYTRRFLALEMSKKGLKEATTQSRSLFWLDQIKGDEMRLDNAIYLLNKRGIAIPSVG